MIIFKTQIPELQVQTGINKIKITYIQKVFLIELFIKGKKGLTNQI